MQVGAHAANVDVVEGDLGLWQAGGLRDRAHRVDNRAHIVVVEQIGHLARIKDIVQVFEKGLLYDLRVGE